VACVRSCRADVPVLSCAFVGASEWRCETAALAGNRAAVDGAWSDGVLLGSDTSCDGYSRGHVCAEIPAAHEHALAAGWPVLGLCGPGSMDAHCGDQGKRTNRAPNRGESIHLKRVRKIAAADTDPRSGDTPMVPSPRNERAVEVVQAAYSLIAEKGFEGLRTREVAERVGINSATLHYYFSTKESLIQAVVEYLMEELKTSRARLGSAPSALERLRAEFTDIRARLREVPEQLIVLTELAVRAWRDPTVARLLNYLDEGWRGHLSGILKQGIAEGEFRPELDVMATANMMMVQLRSLGYQGKLDAAALDGLVEQIALQTEYWVRRRPE
jgi:AcrR family transcriptional regulator